MSEEGVVEVSGRTEPYENVIDFRTRETWEPPEPTPRERIVSRVNDFDAINSMKSMIKDFKKGRHHGLLMVVGEFDDHGNLVNYRYVMSETACSYPISFLGALEQTKLSLAECALGMANEGEHPDESEAFLHGDED